MVENQKNNMSIYCVWRPKMCLYTDVFIWRSKNQGAVAIISFLDFGEVYVSVMPQLWLKKGYTEASFVPII